MKNKNIVMTKEIEQKMEQDPTYQPIETFEKLHDKKPKDMTRRELLATGIIPFAASLTVPSIFSALSSSKAYGQASEADCKKVGAAEISPVINFSLAGGAMLTAEWMPRGKDLSLLTSYSRLGWGRAPSVDQEFKADTSGKKATFFSGSPFLIGVRSIASATTLEATHFIGICCRSGDDSAMNPQGIGGLVEAAGHKGDLINIMGTARTSTGGSNAPSLIPPSSPLVVTSSNDIAGALGFRGTLDLLSDAQQAKMMRAIANVSNHQAVNLISQSGGAALQKLMGCANIENSNLIANQGNLDVSARANAQVAQIYGLNANTAPGAQASIRADILYNVLKKSASSGVISEGGHDSHNGTRTATDANLLRVGTEVGRMLETAVALRKRLFLYVTTDGGQGGPESNDGGAPWTNDRGIAGAAWIIAYDPEQKSKATTTQLGYFTEGQAAAEDTVYGNDVSRMAQVVFLNLLSWDNQFHLLETVLGRKFESHDIDKVRVLFNS